MKQPWAWVSWLVATVVILSITRNPLYLVLILMCVVFVGLVLRQVRTDQPRMFSMWKLALWIMLLSTLFNALTRSEVKAENLLFATLDTASREVPVNGTRVRFTDTVGFIRKLPHDLVASFRATLEEAANADVIVHVVDASHPAWERQAEVVGEVLHELGVNGADTGPRVVVALNKADLLSSIERERRVQDATARGWVSVTTSAIGAPGVAELRSRLGNGA